jgi:hypothetical protein
MHISIYLYREFLSLYIDGLDFRVENKGILRSFELCIDDVQMDNYSETVMYPVLLHSSKKEHREKLKVCMYMYVYVCVYLGRF